MGRMLSLLLIFVILFPESPAEAQTGPTASTGIPAAVAPTPAPVVLDGRTLFHIKAQLLSFSPRERAQAITATIKDVAANDKIDPRSITTVDFEGHSEILAGKQRILAFTNLDARADGLEKGRKEITAFYAEQIRKAIAEYREARKPWNLFLGALYALSVTLVLILVLILFHFLFRKIYARIATWRETKVKALQVQDLEVVSAQQAGEFLVSSFRWLRIVLTVMLFYVYIPLVLEFFPWTRQAGSSIYSLSLNSVALVGKAVWDYLPNLFIIAVIVLLFYYVIKGFKLLFRAIEAGRVKIPIVAPDLAMLTFRIVRFVIIALSIVVLYPYLPGSQSEAFKGVSIFIGVLFSLGSSSVVANIFAGLVLTYMRAFRLGDRVKIGETVGDVIEMKLSGTRIRTVKNVEITISNSQVLQTHVVNFSAQARTRGLILHTSVTIGYDAPWRTIHQLLIDAALKTKDVLKNPPPFVLQTALNDFYITYELNAYTDQSHAMARTYSELHQHIQDTFNEAGMEIMSAHYLHIRDGSRTAIPDPYLPQDYEPRALRVFQNPTAGEETWRTEGKDPEK